LILFSSALELELNNINIMQNLIIDAAADKIFLSLIIDKNIYTCSHENSKSNFEKLIILITNFLNKNKTSINEIDKIYVNRGPGSFAGIRNSLSIVKGFFLTQKIDYYCFSFLDFDKSTNVKYEDVPILCDKFKIKKNLIKPLYLS
jgi:tRNA A37 threonylcarbamoyladenosine modification protein TsaB